VEDGPVHVDGAKVAVAEDSDPHTDEEADAKRAREQEALPQMVQIGTGPKVTRFDRGSLPR
jgi:hypothetical protein